MRGNKTVMTFDVDWKAPFKFDILPQAYRNTSASKRDYSVKEVTFEYIDITFCYADSLELADTLEDNPVFSRAEVIEGDYDRVLRLHLKKKGAFYGWWSEYNDEGQLEFSFLNPATLKEADNEYGYSLEGITVAVDAGHGGKDMGALGFTEGIHEAQLNLKLALELERELTALGATVVMTRTEDVNPTALQRINTVVNSGADIAISVHRNAANRTSANGFDAYHFNPFTVDAARHLLEASLKTGVYRVPQSPMEKWHVFFLSRVTACPVVLTENGFVSNVEDYNNMLDDQKTALCAKALAEGVVNYFKAMQ